MRFMMIIMGNADYEAGIPPSPELMAGMGKLSEEMMKAGVVVANAGLLPTKYGARIALERGKRTVIDGPFAEAKEVIGGFAIIEAASKYEAMALAHRVVDVHADAGIKDMRIEIRPMFEAGECAGTESAAAAAA